MRSHIDIRFKKKYGTLGECSGQDFIAFCGTLFLANEAFHHAKCTQHQDCSPQDCGAQARSAKKSGAIGTCQKVSCAKDLSYQGG